MGRQKTDISLSVAAQVPYLRRFAHALTGNSTLADDLVQDCIERALTRLHLFDETKNLRTWLFTILRNLHLNNLRQKNQRGIHLNIDDVSEQSLIQAPEQSHHMAITDIAKAMEYLPNEQREVLILVTIEEMSYAEIADIIDTPIGTVMSRLSRARSRLKTLMTNNQLLLEKQKND